MRKNTLVAKLDLSVTPNGVDYANEKRELVKAYVVYGLVNNEITELAHASIYMGKSAHATGVYCDFRLRGAECRSSSGKAFGGGYCKKSAAVGTALSKAGIQLFGDVYGEMPMPNQRAHIGGVGESAIEAALVAVSKLSFPKAHKIRMFTIGG